LESSFNSSVFSSWHGTIKPASYKAHFAAIIFICKSADIDKN